MSWVDKVATGNFIANVAPWFATAAKPITEIADQVKIRLVWQLIDDISRALEKLLKHFNGAIISTSFVLLSSDWPVIFSLKLNESVTLVALKATGMPLQFTAGLSLQYYHKLPGFFE